jgi:hypothetical protein
MNSLPTFRSVPQNLFISVYDPLDLSLLNLAFAMQSLGSTSAISNDLRRFCYSSAFILTTSHPFVLPVLYLGLASFSSLCDFVGSLLCRYLLSLCFPLALPRSRPHSSLIWIAHPRREAWDELVFFLASLSSHGGTLIVERL